ncbi:DUF397 domain-containing protein [Sphaerisporangium sp. TRM90804]|uniref:DUF397 domain-containing protein n=1 Tax=Sphaerisporangium sp. TRM90804 TaxID=3031113 RepID=UPI0024476580|nr:DUF397 domain-containing protein [Sphaerisporangium sp. TRM90804]MDH2423867.1 DUF397 domain-containing protein [Sphaerisporangium sp. TRM90804]
MSDASEKAELYALDISGVTWLSAPGSVSDDRIEIAYLPGGAVALRNPADPAGTVLRYTAGEWNAFVLGVRDGEFDD